MLTTTETPGELRSAQAWLETLAKDECSEEDFWIAMQGLMHKSADAGWDLLSLFDQYYRRGKITPEMFRHLKSRLEGQLLGTSLDMDISVPLPRAQPGAPPADQAQPAAPQRPTEQTRPASGPRPTAPPSPPVEAPAVSNRVAAAAARGAPEDTAIGDVLRGRYSIKSVLGRGGTGTVFEAIDQYRLDLPNSGQRVALKVPTGEPTLRREFQLLQLLSHPNIVRVHEYDRDGDTEFFTMEHLSGLPLSRVLSARHQTPLPQTDALAIIRDVASAVSYAHRRGVVHGDVNPGNVFVTYEGEIRVLDFSAAHVAVPLFASCQLLEGQTPDATDDVYSLACLAYLLLSGRHPFGDQTAMIARDQRLRPSRPPMLTHAQWRALRRGLEFDRARRPSDVVTWLRPFALDQVTARLPPLLALMKASAPAKKSSWLPAIAMGVVLLAAIGWWAGGSQLVDEMRSALDTWRNSLDTSPVSQSMAVVTTPTPAPTTPSPKIVHAASAAIPPPAPISTVAPATSAIPAASAVPANSKAPANSTASANSTAAPVSHSRVELTTDVVEVAPGAASARITVRRIGSWHGEASFNWWTESGTAKPGRDFATVASHVEQIATNKGSVDLFVPIVGDSTRREPRSFYVVISDPGPNTSLGGRTLTMVTILPTG